MNKLIEFLLWTFTLPIILCIIVYYKEVEAGRSGIDAAAITFVGFVVICFLLYVMDH